MLTGTATAKRQKTVTRARSERCALITGASSGIGEATALALAARGWKLVLGARREALLSAVCHRVREEFGTEAIYARCDVRSAEDVQHLVDVAVEQYGRIDAVICNAGKGYYARVDETPPEVFRDLFDTNVMGAHNLVRAAVPAMKQAGGGHIIVVGSVVGKISWPAHGPYAATKFALTALTQAMRAELASSNIKVSLVLPVSTDTEFFTTAETLNWSPRPIGVVHSAERVADKIARTIERPRSEVNLVPGMRLAFVFAQAAPWLVDRFARIHYERTRPHRDGERRGVLRRLSFVTSLVQRKGRRAPA